MNWPHFHLMLNHIPAVGILCALGIFLVALVRQSQELQKAGLGVLVMSALLTILVYLTGEFTEEVIENLAGISEAAIERHEDAAKVALVSVGLLGALALGALLLFRKRSDLPKPLVMIALVLTLGVGGLMAWTANAGGQIRHPELRRGGIASLSQVYETERNRGRPGSRAERHDNDNRKND